MHLLDSFPREAGWSIDILATDLSRLVLAHAEAGIWPIERASPIPVPCPKRFMLRGTRSETGRLRAVGPSICSPGAARPREDAR